MKVYDSRKDYELSALLLKMDEGDSQEEPAPKIQKAMDETVKACFTIMDARKTGDISHLAVRDR